MVLSKNFFLILKKESISSKCIPKSYWEQYGCHLLHTCFNHMCAYFNHCSNSYLNGMACINYAFLPILLSMSAVTQLLLLLQSIAKAVEEGSTRVWRLDSVYPLLKQAAGCLRKSSF